MINKEAIINAGKEFLRVVVLAVIPLIIAGLDTGIFDWRIIGTVGAIAGLRFIDKYLHEVGKERSTARKESILLKGLTRF